MALSKEDEALFANDDDVEPVQETDDALPADEEDPFAVEEPEQPPQLIPAVVPAAGGPVASKRPAMFPQCGDCKADLDPTNSSKLRDGTFSHIGCPAKAAPAVEPAAAPAKRAKKAAAPPPVAAPEKSAEPAAPTAASLKPAPAPAASVPAPGATLTRADLARALRAFANALEQT